MLSESKGNTPRPMLQAREQLDTEQNRTVTQEANSAHTSEIEKLSTLWMLFVPSKRTMFVLPQDLSIRLVPEERTE